MGSGDVTVGWVSLPAGPDLGEAGEQILVRGGTQ